MDEIKEYWTYKNGAVHTLKNGFRKVLRTHFFRDDQDRVQGEFKEYYSNGNLRTHAFYKDNVASGPYTTFYEAGTIEIRSHKSHGWDHGEMIRMHEDGTILHHAIYLNGVKAEELGYVLSNDDRLMLALKYGVPMLDEDYGY